MDGNKIIFFYPSRIVGGAENLFILMTKQLIARGIEVSYIDYKEGFARKELQGLDVNFLTYEDGKKTEINSVGTVITPISNFYRITDYIDVANEDLKLFFWCIHPYNVLHVLPEHRLLVKIAEKNHKIFMKLFCKVNYKSASEILQQLNRKKAIAFMDYANFILNSPLFDLGLDKNYLPVPIEQKKYFSTGGLVSPNEMNIVILGRLSKDKIYSVINVLDNLYKVKTDRKIICHIIGDGEAKSDIKVDDYKGRLNIVFTSTLLSTELDQYLIDYADVLFAMGTSAIIGAGLKIPVILLDYGFEPFSTNQFLYLFNAIDYSLGNHYTVDNKNKIEFSKIIDDIYVENKKQNLGLACYDYFLSNHNVDHVVGLLIDKIQKDDLTFRDYSTIKKSVLKIKKNKSILYTAAKIYFSSLELIKGQGK